MSVKLSTLKKGDLFRVVGDPDNEVLGIEIVFGENNPSPYHIQVIQIDEDTGFEIASEYEIRHTNFIDVIKVEKVITFEECKEK